MRLLKLSEIVLGKDSLTMHSAVEVKFFVFAWGLGRLSVIFTILNNCWGVFLQDYNLLSHYTQRCCQTQIFNKLREVEIQCIHHL